MSLDAPTTEEAGSETSGVYVAEMLAGSHAFARLSRNELVRLLLREAADDLECAQRANVHVAEPVHARRALLDFRLAVAREILVRDLASQLARGPVLASPERAREWLRLRYVHLQHEVFSLLHLDTQNRLIEAEDIFRGTLTQTSVYPREVVKSALARNAAALILVHNHPSGTPEASAADRLLTQTIKQAVALVDVRVLDHLIVAGSSIYSFAEKGLL